MKTKKPAYIKNKKQKSTDYVSLALLLIAVIAITTTLYNIKFQETDFDNNRTIEENSYKYNGFVFNKVNGLWQTQIEKNGLLFDITTEYSPREVEHIKTIYEPNKFPLLTKPGKTVYITFNPQSENLGDVRIAAIDFAAALSTVYAVDVKSACMKNSSGCIEVQTCNTTQNAVIELLQSNETSIFFKDNCLQVYGKNKELIKAVNRVLFEWYGIITVNETTGVIYTI